MNLEKNKNYQANCIHAKNIYNLLDSNLNDSQMIEFQNHIKHCPYCEAELRTKKEQLLGLSVFIPKPVMDKELKETFNRELHELLINFGLNDRANAEKKTISFFSNLNNYGETILKTIFSKSMFLAYGFAGMLYLILKYYV